MRFRNSAGQKREFEMKILRSLASAFLMYSKIPMPKVEWREENRRYALCFFPLVGAVVGAVFWLWRRLCERLCIGIFLNSAVSVAIPILITGGIHLDGFCDVSDAVSAYAQREKRLEILNDPHIGAFAAIKLCVYFLLQFALLCEVGGARADAVIAVGFVLSRAISGLCAVTFKNAKNSGALFAFSNPAHKKITVGTLVFVIIACVAAMLIFGGVTGIFAVFGAGLTFVFYRHFSYKNFGGITGDLAGWFLQICELSMLIFVELAKIFSEVAAF